MAKQTTTIDKPPVGPSQKQGTTTPPPSVRAKEDVLLSRAADDPEIGGDLPRRKDPRVTTGPTASESVQRRTITSLPSKSRDILGEQQEAAYRPEKQPKAPMVVNKPKPKQGGDGTPKAKGPILTDTRKDKHLIEVAGPRRSSFKRKVMSVVTNPPPAPPKNPAKLEGGMIMYRTLEEALSKRRGAALPAKTSRPARKREDSSRSGGARGQRTAPKVLSRLEREDQIITKIPSSAPAKSNILQRIEAKLEEKRILDRATKEIQTSGGKRGKSKEEILTEAGARLEQQKRDRPQRPHKEESKPVRTVSSQKAEVRTEREPAPPKQRKTPLVAPVRKKAPSKDKKTRSSGRGTKKTTPQSSKRGGG